MKRILALILGILIGICISNSVIRLIKGPPEFEYIGENEEGYSLIRYKDKSCTLISKTLGYRMGGNLDPSHGCYWGFEKYIGKTPQGDEIYGSEGDCYTINSKTKKVIEHSYENLEIGCN